MNNPKMNRLELIDRLCAIMEMQSEIIREQETFIEEHLAVDDAVKKRYAAKRSIVETEIASLERRLRRE